MGIKHDYSVDLLRVGFMFGICTIHVSGFSCGYENRYISWMNLFAVPGFVFITGWFGIKFSLWKLFKLYMTALYCSIVVQLVKILLGVGSFDIVQMLKMFRGYWFLNAYAVLMFFAPMLDMVTRRGVEVSDNDKRDILKVLMPILVLVYGWAFVRSISWCNGWMFVSAGVEPMSGLMMIGVYLFARLSRMYGLDRKLPTWALVAILILGYPLEFIGLGSYTSIFASFMALAWFLLIRKFKYGVSLGKVVAWMVPSLFSVYMFHSHNAVGFPLITQYNTSLIEDMRVPIVWMYVISTLTVFGIGILLDAPRRILVKLCSQIMNSVKR